MCVCLSIYISISVSTYHLPPLDCKLGGQTLFPRACHIILNKYLLTDWLLYRHLTAILRSLNCWAGLWLTLLYRCLFANTRCVKSTAAQRELPPTRDHSLPQDMRSQGSRPAEAMKQGYLHESFSFIPLFELWPTPFPTQDLSKERGKTGDSSNLQLCICIGISPFRLTLAWNNKEERS